MLIYTAAYNGEGPFQLSEAGDLKREGRRRKSPKNTPFFSMPS